MAETMTRYYPKKITTKFCHLDTETLEEYAEANGKKKPAPVLTVFGRVRKSATEQSTYGPYQRYSGEFEAINLVDQTSHRSRVLILPEVAEQALDELIGQVQRANPEALVEFGLTVTVEYYDNPNKSGTKFRFGVSPLGKPSDDDALGEIGKRLGAIPQKAVEQKAAEQKTTKTRK